MIGRRKMVFTLATAALTIGLGASGIGAVGRAEGSPSWYEAKPPPKALDLSAIPDGIDGGHAAQGIVTLRHRSDKKTLLQVQHGERVSTYRISGRGEAESYPLNYGSGDYLARLMEHVEGTRYRRLSEEAISAVLDSETSPYETASSVVRYNEGSRCVMKAEELAQASRTASEFTHRAVRWVERTISYDHGKAEKELPYYTADPDGTISEGQGICIDMATLLAAMLRSQSIPARVTIGYMEGVDTLHAWNEAYLDGQWETIGMASAGYGSVESIERHQ